MGTLELLRAGKLDEARAQHSPWYNLAVEEWTEMQAASKAKRPARRFFRFKALKWLVALDHAMSHYGVSLKSFLLPKLVIDRPPARDWPVLSLSFDQGSDGWPAIHFLAYNLPMSVLWMEDSLNLNLWPSLP